MEIVPARTPCYRAQQIPLSDSRTDGVHRNQPPHTESFDDFFVGHQIQEEDSSQSYRESFLQSAIKNGSPVILLKSPKPRIS